MNHKTFILDGILIVVDFVLIFVLEKHIIPALGVGHLPLKILIFAVCSTLVVCTAIFVLNYEVVDEVDDDVEVEVQDTLK